MRVTIILFVLCVSAVAQSDYSSVPPPGAAIPEPPGKYTCNVEKCVVRKDPRSAPSTISQSDIEAMMGDPQHMHWVKAFSASFSCVDGRNTGEILGTPGGDLGEFILALSVYEELTGRQLEPGDTGDILMKYLQQTQKNHFRMCTDTDALQALQDTLNLNTLNIRNPPEDKREAILAAVVAIDPRRGAYTTGSRHIRAMLESPAEYFVRPELVQHIVRAFYALLWAGHPKLILDVFTGCAQQEVAVVNVGTGSQCYKNALVPKVGRGSAGMLINHPDAVQFYRADLAAFVGQRCQKGILPDAFKHRMNTRAQLTFMSTLQRIAIGLPYFTVTFL